MKKENTLTKERMIELEKWLEENNRKNLHEEIELLENFNEEERNYLLIAQKLPKELIEKIIEYNDKYNYPNIKKELMYLHELSKNLHVEKLVLINRIKQVIIQKEPKKIKIKVKKVKK